MTQPAHLPPVDQNVAPTVADADRERAIRTYRRLLAQGGASPSRQRQLAHELRLIEGGAAPKD